MRTRMQQVWRHLLPDQLGDMPQRLISDCCVSTLHLESPAPSACAPLRTSDPAQVPFPRCGQAQFVVRREAVRRLPLDFWQKLANWLREAPNETAYSALELQTTHIFFEYRAHALEQLWRTLFDAPPDDYLGAC